ncbi:MAG TPA: preprotein translocase subunit YajC [Gaiellaceae bacterium]|jgi:preprotein translocase subunit YajC
MILEAAAKSSSGGQGFLIIIVLGLAAMWLIFIRPQRRKQKMQQSMQSELAVGDEILTAGGVYGKVTRIDDEQDEIGVEIAPNVEVRLARRAIAAQFTDREPDPETATDESEDASDEPAPDAESDTENPG